MKQRIVTGVFGGTAFLYLLWLGGWWYSTLLFFLATVAYLEYCRLMELNWKKTQVWLSLLIVWFLLLAALMRQDVIPSVPLLEESNILLLGMIFLFIFMICNPKSFDLGQMSFLFVGSVYIGFGFSFMLELIWKDNGLFFTLLIILVIWATDTGAYFVGKNFGKRKLWPAISPNKTLEGSLGGVILAVVITLVFSLFIPSKLPLLQILLLSIAISIIGQIGDLVESSWKRSTGVKDSGRILPGHGGILDRFDSLLFSCIVLHLIQSF